MAIYAALLMPLSLAGALATLQDPRMNMQIAAPQLDNSIQAVPPPAPKADPTRASSPAAIASTGYPGLDKTVTVSFHSASMKEVLKWLNSKSDTKFVVNSASAQEQELTLNLLDQPLSAVVDAISDALGGRFVKQGNAYVLQTAAPRAPRYGNLWSTPALPPRSGRLLAPRAGSLRLQTPLSFTDAFALQPGPKYDEKATREYNKNHPGARVRVYIEKDAPTLKASEWISPNFMGRSNQNLKQLIDSLTPAQKELSKKQGYLHMHDLTPAQRGLLGITSTGGTFDMQFSIDGKKLSIKN